MSDEPDNLTLRLLQEMRADMSELRNEMRSRFDDLETRVDGNTVLLNMVAGLLHNHDQRLDTIKARQN